MKKYKYLALLLACVLLMPGCGSTAEETASESAAEDSAAYSSALDVSEMFTDRDYEVGYEESESAVITLSGDQASCDSSAVQISGTTITIIDEGTYILRGSLEDGMIIVNAEDSDKVQLVLDNVEIISESSAAIYVKQADKVFLTMAEGSVNTLENGGLFADIDENNIDAAVFSKEDLTLNGNGTLTILSPAGHGIVSKDDLVITSGSYEITASSHGLSGKDSVRIAHGEFVIASGKDGVHAENADDETLGFVYIANGSFEITSEGDGISASNILQIDGGTFAVTAGGGAAEAESVQGDDFGFKEMFAEDTSEADSEDSVSTKGVKSSGSMVLNGGSFTIDSADDAFHSNADCTVNGGTYEIATGDDGFHADENLNISGGTITVSESYEGLEGLSIDISGGTIDVTASDDGLNAAGGADQSGFGGRAMEGSFTASSDYYINISGGLIYVDADGDGVDSNGTVNISGGELYISGPTDGANAALDYETDGVITGGTVVALGSSGMAANFGSSSTQGAMLVSVGNQSAGSAVELTDSEGQVLISWEAGKDYSSVLLSCPEITEGGTYTLTAGTYSGEITMDSLIYGGGMGGGMDPGMNGGKGGRMDGGSGTPGEGGEMGEMPEAPEDNGEMGEMPGMPGEGGEMGEMQEMPDSGKDMERMDGNKGGMKGGQGGKEF